MTDAEIDAIFHANHSRNDHPWVDWRRFARAVVAHALPATPLADHGLPSHWFKPGAVVPVSVETVALLLDAVKRIGVDSPPPDPADIPSVDEMRVLLRGQQDSLKTADLPAGESVKPCPFCGSINIIYNEWFACYCHSCGAEGPDADNQHDGEAIALWNQRAVPIPENCAKCQRQLRLDGQCVECDFDETAGEFPEGLLDRVKAALQRVQDGHSPRRIPADVTDVDLVLAEVRDLIEGRWPPFWIKPSDTVLPVENIDRSVRNVENGHANRHVGINGLTEAETSATASVFGLSSMAPAKPRR